jgi:hypothetical protein
MGGEAVNRWWLVHSSGLFVSRPNQLPVHEAATQELWLL